MEDVSWVTPRGGHLHYTQMIVFYDYVDGILLTRLSGAVTNLAKTVIISDKYDRCMNTYR